MTQKLVKWSIVANYAGYPLLMLPPESSDEHEWRWSRKQICDEAAL